MRWLLHLLLAAGLAVTAAAAPRKASAKPARKPAARKPAKQAPEENPAPGPETGAPAAGAVTYTVTGTATLPDKKPAAGARVWLAWAGRFTDRGTTEGKADAAGHFKLAARVTGAGFLAVG